MSSEISIRPGLSDDVPAILGLIKELAHYERAAQEVSLTDDDLLKDGFGNDPRFRTILAVSNEEVIGMALYYERYSTWKGPTLYLEDLVVSPDHRNNGAGKKLMQKMIDIAREGDYRRLEWQVLDWNNTAIEFYKAIGVKIDSSWLNCRITF